MDRKKLLKIGLMIATVGVTATTIYLGFQYMRRKMMEKKKQQAGTTADPGSSASAKTSGTNENPELATQGRTGAGQGKGPVVGGQRGGATENPAAATKGRG